MLSIYNHYRALTRKTESWEGSRKSLILKICITRGNTTVHVWRWHSCTPPSCQVFPHTLHTRTPFLLVCVIDVFGKSRCQQGVCVNWTARLATAAPPIVPSHLSSSLIHHLFLLFFSFSPLGKPWKNTHRRKRTLRKAHTRNTHSLSSFIVLPNCWIVVVRVTQVVSPD